MMRSPLGLTPALLCFWAGTLILLVAAARFGNAALAERRARRSREERDALRLRRRAALRTLPFANEAIRAACRDAETARTPADRSDAEQEISRQVRALLSTPAGEGDEQTTVREAIAAAEGRLAGVAATCRDRTRAAVIARRAFPAGAWGGVLPAVEFGSDDTD